MIWQIRYFQSVIRNNSFSEAAEECHISQSAISQQVQALERELGFDLLERKFCTQKIWKKPVFSSLEDKGSCRWRV